MWIEFREPGFVEMMRLLMIGSGFKDWRGLRFGHALSLCAALAAIPAASTSMSVKPAATAERDGRHDFDWDIGLWSTHQRRLLHPLTGSTTWVEYHGTDVVRRIWDGANSAIIEADGPAGHLEIFSTRLYNPDAHQWNITFSTPDSGVISQPVIGEFSNHRADFYDQEFYKGRAILVRFSISRITKDSCHFEQAFSDDGGRSWEINFIVDETRVRKLADRPRTNSLTFHP